LASDHLAECRKEIVQLLELHRCTTLAFDLTGVKYIPSGMLGLLASLRRMEIEVHLYNPSSDVREVLKITGLNRLFRVHELAMFG
jgi:anti-sigma B factor antagonist